MAVELTGYSRQINQASMLKQGLEDLRHADREQAREHLKDLRRDLQTKSGVVRLLHTTKTDKDMKFKNAGAFKRMFLSGDKLKRSGDVITDLLRNAGLSEAKVQEFSRYAAARGNKGVEAQKVLKYIDALQADTGHSPEEALGKFGVNLGAMGRRLGDGAFGEVHLVSYRGEEFVYKNPLGNRANIGELTLVDGAGKEIQPDRVVLEKSYVEANDDDSFVHKGPANPLLSPKKTNEYQYEDSKSDDAESFLYQDPQDDLRQFILGQVFNKQSFDFPGPVSDSIEDPKPEISAQQPPQNSTQNSPSNPPESVQAPNDPVPPLLISEEDPLDAQQPQPVLPPEAQQKLARTGLGNVARVTDLPQVITPSVVVVKEGLSNGTERYHAVAGQKTLKDWAKIQNKGSSFEVVGLLMPKAAGKNPIDHPENRDPKVNVSRSDLKPMAQSAMTLLKGMAKHGFIHGDIKPANLMWDPKSKKLQLIDNDNLVKVSKNAGSTVPEGLGPASLAYLHPLAMHEEFRSPERKRFPKPLQAAFNNAQLGLGRDLYATGLVLLEASLLAGGGDVEQANRIMNGVNHQNMSQGELVQLLATKSTENRIEHLKGLDFEAHTVQDFARNCLIKALEFEQDRIDRKDFGFDRRENGREANLLRELEDQLAQVR